jgi:type II secretory pathway predicted ATPase ExeA
MLCQYFGFREEPFGATPDPRWLYRSATHREALASLRYGFYSNRGFTALIAPPGMGKTTLLNQFLHDIRNSARSVFLFDTQCEPLGLLRYILRDLGITPAITGDEMHEQLKGVLLKEAGAGRKFVIVMDEAQNLSEEALEMLRLLTNFETPRTKLLQIVLAGQPTLSDKLMDPCLEQLRQRISTICYLEPFSSEQTTAYIRHRLEQSGYRGAPLFRRDALKLITETSRGNPRIINTLCFNALSLCFALKSKQVDESMMAEVIADQELIELSRRTFAYQDNAKIEQLPRRRASKLAIVNKFLVAAAALLLVVSGVGLLEHSVSRKTGVHLTDYLRFWDTQVLSASIPAPAPQIADTAVTDNPHSKSEPVQITIERGQTLHDISMHYLGAWDLKRLHQIRTLNPTLRDLDYIQAGQKIWLPAKEPASTK